MRKISFSFFMLCIFFSLTLTGCSNETTTEDTKSKVSQELEYLDGKILTIANKLNNITLQNYTISSEEVLLGEESSGAGQSSEQGNSSGGGNDSQQKQSTSQSGGEQSKESNITTTQIEPKSILSIDLIFSAIIFVAFAISEDFCVASLVNDVSSSLDSVKFSTLSLIFFIKSLTFSWALFKALAVIPNSLRSFISIDLEKS